MNTTNYNLIYHFNPHSDLWYCFDRVDYVRYWNDKSSIRYLGIGKTSEEAKENYNNQIIYE